jgi:acetyl-CoA carboxylase biotin carboxylase subunit
VPPFYDSLLGKVIAHGPDRATALARLRVALAETRIAGVATSVSFLADVLADPEFANGGVDTGFLPRYLARSVRGA